MRHCTSVENIKRWAVCFAVVAPMLTGCGGQKQQEIDGNCDNNLEDFEGVLSRMKTIDPTGKIGIDVKGFNYIKECADKKQGGDIRQKPLCGSSANLHIHTGNEGDGVDGRGHIAIRVLNCAEAKSSKKVLTNWSLMCAEALVKGNGSQADQIIANCIAGSRRLKLIKGAGGVCNSTSVHIPFSPRKSQASFEFWITKGPDQCLMTNP